ncbi:MAG: DMT family transporter [Rhodobacteraceae bacterium]|nr:DMT family transporter [Paracoccaceae bacterium]
MSSTATSNLRGVLAALVAFGIFATHDVAVKTLGGYYAPFHIIFFSVLLTYPLVALMLLHDAKADNLRPKHPRWTALRTSSIVVSGLCTFYAFSVLPLAQVYAILFASPLVITVLSIPILGEVVRLRRGLAVLVGLGGVLIVLRPGSAELQPGHLAAMIGAIFSGLASVVVRKIGRDERSAVLLLYPLTANFVVMACALPFVYEPMPVEHLGLIAIVASFAFIAGLFLIAAYRMAEAAMVAPMQYSQILWATAYGYFFFEELPDQGTLIGAGVIIASGLYIVLRESRGNSANNPVLETRTRWATPTMPRISAWLRLRDSK